jgi:uncharacterized metal-binding protein YceD (DUF177 family)
VTDHLDWIEKSTDIPAGGLKRDREATSVELRQIAQALDILKVGNLSSHYRITAIAGGAYRLAGTIAADVEQSCIVSLEPVSGKIKAAFDVEFWPTVTPGDSDEEASILSGSDVEVLDHGLIPVGRIVFETLSASLDPYPRREGAEFNWQDPKAEKAESANPFAALSKLKDQG